MVAKVVGNLAVSDKDKEEDGQSSVPKGSFATIIKKLVAKAKDKGFITYDELNKALPAEEFSSEQIEDAMASFSDMGLQIVESEDDVDESEDESDEKSDYKSGGNIADDDTGRTDDPVRMYLREMGAVELLSREGEIAIAKRIEAGRELMIGGICESPLAIESIIAWYEALQAGDIQLREVIDLDATYSDGPKPRPMKMTPQKLMTTRMRTAMRKVMPMAQPMTARTTRAICRWPLWKKSLRPACSRISAKSIKPIKRCKKCSKSALMRCKKVMSRLLLPPKNIML